MKETKFISEVEYLRFKDKFRTIIIEIIVGMVIGLLFNRYLLGMDSIGGYIFSAIMFAGVPYAWQFMPVFFGGVVGILINLIIVLLLGWIITPIAFVYNFIQMKRYENHVKDALESENLA
jgi:hypothetical protein